MERRTSPEGWGLGVSTGSGAVVELDVSLGLVQAATRFNVLFGFRVPGHCGLACSVPSPQSHCNLRVLPVIF